MPNNIPSIQPSCACEGEKNNRDCCPSPGLEMLPIYKEPDQDEPCCGPPAGPPSSPLEKPGYTLCAFVRDFIETPVGPVPRIHTKLNREDRWGTVKSRAGIGRDRYKVTPGLYAVGRPTQGSPVLVTANYKLSFDQVRSRLLRSDAWLLVLDTRGINVWCAAGKGTIGTRELVQRVLATGLDKVVRHRRLILPQLGATGVSAHDVKKGCGFEVVWGPVRAADIESFLAGRRSEAMRRVTFTLGERLVLVPVEFYLIRKTLLWVAAAIFLVSGIGQGFFPFQRPGTAAFRPWRSAWPVWWAVCCWCRPCCPNCPAGPLPSKGPSPDSPSVCCWSSPCRAIPGWG